MFSKIVSGGIEELRKIVPIGENTSDLIQFILPIIEQDCEEVILEI